MKKKAVFSILGSLLLSLVSCASSPQGFKDAETLLPLEIAAVTAPDRIQWFSEDGESESGLFEELFRKEEQEQSRMAASLLVSAAEQILFDSLKSKHIAIVERDVTPGSETGMKSAAFVHFSFYTDLSAGIAQTGSMFGFVIMEVKLTAPDGKRLANRTYTAKMDETIAVRAGKFDMEELLALYPAAITAVCEEFALDFVR
jgi:hypothetical protein